MMGICEGLVGPQSGHVEKVLVLTQFLKVQRGEGVNQEDEQDNEPEGC